MEYVRGDKIEHRFYSIYAQKMLITDLLSRSESGSQFFQHYVQSRRETSRNFSLRQLAVKLGYNNPSLLSEILRGRRRANMDLFHRFTSLETLGHLERTYLANLIEIERSGSPTHVANRSHENRCIQEYWRSGRLQLQESQEGISLTASLTEDGRRKAMDILKRALEEISLLSMEPDSAKTECTIRGQITACR